MCPFADDPRSSSAVDATSDTALSADLGHGLVRRGRDSVTASSAMALKQVPLENRGGRGIADDQIHCSLCRSARHTPLAEHGSDCHHGCGCAGGVPLQEQRGSSSLFFAEQFHIPSYILRRNSSLPQWDGRTFQKQARNSICKPLHCASCLRRPPRTNKQQQHETTQPVMFQHHRQAVTFPTLPT